MCSADRLAERHIQYPFDTYPIEQNEYSSLLLSYRDKAQELIRPETMGSIQEYLGYALLEGCKAAETTWGVGAVIDILHQGEELIIKGRNVVFESENPKDHAEGNALDIMSLLISASKSNISLTPEQNQLLVERTDLRKIDKFTLVENLKRRFSLKSVHNISIMDLITSVEPCRMCKEVLEKFETVCPFKFSSVWIASEDRIHAAKENPKYFKFLSKVKNPADPMYVSPEYLQLAGDIYLLSRSKVGEQKRQRQMDAYDTLNDLFDYRRNLSQ